MRLLISTAIALMLGACGGETGWIPCSTESSVSISAQWNTNGLVAADVQGKMNVPLTATPILSGVPASCVGKGEFIQRLALPAGLQMDTQTGIISGTPIKNIGFNVNGMISIRLPGYSDMPVLSKITILP